MLRAVFRLALRQTEGVIASVLQLLGVDRPVPEPARASAAIIALRPAHARTVTLPGTQPCANGALHLLVDSTGLKLYGPGEWLVAKHGTQCRRA